MRGLAALALCLAACPIDPPRPSPEPDGGAGDCVRDDPEADGDGDGFAAIACGGTDCRDDDPTVFPGAPDPVDDGAVDQNCDGLDGVDEDGDGEASIASGGVDCDDGHSAVQTGGSEASGFVRDRVPAPGLPVFLSIALDPRDARVHLLWSSGTDRQMWHATNATGPWTAEIAWSPDANFAALVVGPDGRLHALANNIVAEGEASPRWELQYTTRGPSDDAWTDAIVVDAGAQGDYSVGVSAASAPDGTVYVAHQLEREPPDAPFTNVLRMIEIRTDGSTRALDIDEGRANGFQTSVVTDASGHPHVVWTFCGGGCENRPVLDLDASVLYATNASGEWVVEPVGGPEHSRVTASIGIDPDGVVWVAYERVTDLGLWVARRTDAGWEESVVDPGHFLVAPIHLSIGADGALQLVYVTFEEGYSSQEVRYATNASGTWRIARVDDTAIANEPVLALDRESRPVIGYTRAGRGEVLVAWTDGIDSDCDGQDF